VLGGSVMRAMNSTTNDASWELE